MSGIVFSAVAAFGESEVYTDALDMIVKFRRMVSLSDSSS